MFFRHGTPSPDPWRVLTSEKHHSVAFYRDDRRHDTVVRSTHLQSLPLPDNRA